MRHHHSSGGYTVANTFAGISLFSAFIALFPPVFQKNTLLPTLALFLPVLGLWACLWVLPLFSPLVWRCVWFGALFASGFGIIGGLTL